MGNRNISERFLALQVASGENKEKAGWYGASELASRARGIQGGSKSDGIMDNRDIEVGGWFASPVASVGNRDREGVLSMSGVTRV